MRSYCVYCTYWWDRKWVSFGNACLVKAWRCFWQMHNSMHFQFIWYTHFHKPSQLELQLSTKNHLGRIWVLKYVWIANARPRWWHRSIAVACSGKIWFPVLDHAWWNNEDLDCYDHTGDHLHSNIEGAQYWEGSLVLWRVFRAVEDVQYCGGCLVMWRVFRTVEGVKNCGGCSELWRMFSTVEGVTVKNCGGCSELWRMFRTVEGV